MKHLSTQFFFTVAALGLLMLSFVLLPAPVMAQTRSISINGSLTTFFATPATSSPAQSYTVTATGLVDNLIVTTPANQHFEVSTDNSTWSSFLSLVPGEVNNVSKTVYVRYSPPGNIAVSTNNGQITHESNGAESRSISVTGRNRPTIKFTGTFAKVVNQITNVPSPGQQVGVEGNLLSGSISVSAPDYFQVALEEVGPYGPSVSFNPNAGAVNSSFWVRFNPQALLGSWSDNVSASSPDAQPQILAVEGNAIAMEPTGQAEIALGMVGTNSVEVTFTGGSGGRRLVVARLATAAAVFPRDGRNYVANPSFASGGFTGMGNSVVYSNPGNSVTVTGLAENAEYAFDVYEFNDGGVAGAENYLAPPSTITTFTKMGVLPVTLIHFTGTLSEEKHALLQWATGMELNNHRFEVERSKDGIFFETIGVVKGAGTTNERREYKLTDPAPFRGTTYYRLRQIDYDATTAYSKTIAVQLQPKRKYTLPINVYPNPTADFLQIALGSSSKVFQVQIVDMLGRQVMQEPAPVMVNEQAYSLDVSSLPTGTYQLLITSDEGKTAKKFLKTNR